MSSKEIKISLIVVGSMFLILGVVSVYLDLPNYNHLITNFIVCYVGAIVIEAGNKNKKN